MLGEVGKESEGEEGTEEPTPDVVWSSPCSRLPELDKKRLCPPPVEDSLLLTGTLEGASLRIGGGGELTPKKLWPTRAVPFKGGDSPEAVTRGENTGDVGDCKVWLADIAAADSKSNEWPR